MKHLSGLSGKKILPEEALKKAGRYCAYQERSQQEVRDKLYSWGLHKNQVEPIIAELISLGFLNEERFALAYAGGKFRIKKWGRGKIIHELKKKKVTEYCISKALKEIDEKEYRSAIRKLIAEKSKKLGGEDPVKKKYKIARSIILKGYEPELVWEMLGDEP